MALSIEPVTSRRLLREFIGLPWRLYRGDPNWVPPLVSEERKLLDPSRGNPFFRRAEPALFLARGERGALRGRVAAIENRAHNAFHNDRVGFFGFFECENDPAVARALLDAARGWAKARGLDRLRGPVNPSTNDSCGTLVEGFDRPPVFMMTYNPPYHDGLLAACGLGKVMDLKAYYLSDRAMPIERLERLARRLVGKEDLRVRSVDLGRFREEVQTIRELYNRAWAPNWGFVPMSEEEFDYAAKGFRAVVVPDFLLIAESGGRPVGFTLALPDLNRAIRCANGRLFPFGWWKMWRALRRIRFARVLTLGIVPEHQAGGAGALLYYELLKRGNAMGYHEGEMSWVLETNTLMNRAMETMGGRVYKTYRIYEGGV